MAAKKVLWALDAFTQSPQLEKKGMAIVPALYKGMGFQIQPVFVLSDLDISASNYHPPVKKGLSRVTKSMKLKNLKAPKILTDIATPLNVRSLVREIIKYASKQKADLIVTHTTSQTSLSRMFLGSFAETLMFHSKTPLLIINPHVTPKSKVSRLFVPTDLSAAAFKSFKTVVNRSQKIGSSVVLYHKVVDAAYLWDKRAEEKFIQSSPLKKYLKYAQDHDVKITVKLDKKPTNTAKAISDMSRRLKCDVIAMHSSTGPLSAIFVGSTTRQVVRLASMPVWIL